MCGIIGSTEHKIDRVLLNEIHHRGPDSNGLYDDENISLGHVRLSILDVKNGNQPMISHDGKVVLIFNGEIYNYKELKEDLPGIKFETNSDTEVLIKYYEKFGIEKTLESINGMFSFCIYDKRASNKLYLVRDRLGIKPLFYSLHNKNISFCSEISPLKDLIGLENLTIDPVAVSMFFNTYYISAPNTIWNEIRSLEPGHYISFEEDKHQINRYWSLKPQDRNNNDLEHLENLLRSAVSLRMRSDVPYGAYLSGGVASSMVVKHMSEYTSNPKTFTAEIIDKELNEKEYADLVAKQYDTDHTTIKIKYPEIKLSFLRKLVSYFGQPFADSSIIPTYWISKEIAKNVVVALGGDGSDEVFCGYNKYNDKEKDIPSRFFRNLDNSFLSEEYRKDTFKHMLSHLPYETQDKNEILRLLDIRFFLEGDILQKVDRMSMASSLEVRVPFLDHRIVEYSNTLTKDLMFGNIRKKPVKKLLEKYFSKDFVHRSKIGFMLNFDGWTDAYDDYIMNSKAMTSGFFNKKFDIKKISSGYLKFAMLVFILWYEEHYV